MAVDKSSGSFDYAPPRTKTPALSRRSAQDDTG
jgi:hypothetical protein